MESCFPRSMIAVSISLSISPVLLAATDVEFEQLRQQMTEVQQQYETQNVVLKAMATRLQQLENGTQAPRYVKVGGAQPSTKSSETPSNGSPASLAENSTKEDAPVIKEASKSRSAEIVYQEQQGLFDRKFTLEGGLTYSHVDRRDLLLNGFLALDAIFLGNINLDRIKADTWTFNATGRYSMTDRLQLDLSVPYIYRWSDYSSVGAMGSTSAVSQADVKDGDLGDVSLGAYYRLFPETNNSPDTVVSLRIKAPTGNDPYGIKIVQVGSNLSVPTELPTGNGVWAATLGASFIKTVDPAILFTNIAYTYNFEENFNDISSDIDTTTQADIDLGDQIAIGAGVAFALSERMSLSTSYSHQVVLKTRIKTANSDWEDVTGSDASFGSLNFGVTYSMADNLALLGSVAIGVTPDAPDVTVSLRLPYSF